VTDWEIEEMRNRLAQTKNTLDKDQQELASRKGYVWEMAWRLDEDKMRISQ
jgi:hypothetical protein